MNLEDYLFSRQAWAGRFGRVTSPQGSSEGETESEPVTGPPARGRTPVVKPGEASLWSKVAGAAVPQSVALEPQEGISFLSGPALQVVTLDTALLEQALESLGSVVSVERALREGQAAGVVEVLGGRVLVRVPGPKSAMLQAFDITRVVDAVTARLRAEGGTGPLETVEPTTEGGSIQPIVTHPGRSAAAGRFLARNFKPAQGKGWTMAVSGEPMTMLRVAAGSSRQTGDEAAEAPGTGKAGQKASRGTSAAPRLGSHRAATGEASGKPGKSAELKAAGPPKTPAAPKAPARAPAVTGGAPLRVESTLEELTRVIRKSDRQEKEDARDRRF